MKLRNILSASLILLAVATASAQTTTQPKPAGTPQTPTKPGTPATGTTPANGTQNPTAPAPAGTAKPAAAPATGTQNPAKPGKPAPARIGGPRTGAPAAKTGAATKGGSKIPVKDTLAMRDQLKAFYNDCIKKNNGACDSAVILSAEYFTITKGEDPSAAYMRSLSYFQKLNNMLQDEMSRYKGKSTSGIKNMDAMIAAFPREKKDELMKVAEAAKKELTWFTEVYNTEEKSMFRLGDVQQKLAITVDYINKLK